MLMKTLNCLQAAAECAGFWRRLSEAEEAAASATATTAALAEVRGKTLPILKGEQSHKYQLAEMNSSGGVNTEQVLLRHSKRSQDVSHCADVIWSLPII